MQFQIMQNNSRKSAPTIVVTLTCFLATKQHETKFGLRWWTCCLNSEKTVWGKAEIGEAERGQTRELKEYSRGCISVELNDGFKIKSWFSLLTSCYDLRDRKTFVKHIGCFI